MELYPGFSLYRGLYEFSQYAFKRNLNGSDGMKWKDFNDSAMEEIFYIIIVEWFVALIAAYYIDKISSSGIDPFFFLKNQNPFKKSPSPYGLQRQVSAIAIEMEKLDVAHEVLQNVSQLFFVYVAILLKRFVSIRESKLSS